MTTLARLRRLLVLVVLMGLVGTTVDLVFIQHHEDVLQFIPFAVIGLSVVAAIWWLTVPRRPAALTFQLAMALLVATGGVGAGLHYRGSAEFQLESDPSATGWPLFRRTLESKAPPVMAPSSLALLGLVGLASMYRLEAPKEDRNDS